MTAKCECECWSDRGPVFPGGGRAPQARAVTHGHGPPLVGKQHGLYVVDVGDGEWAPVFSYDHSQARDRTRRGGREVSSLSVSKVSFVCHDISLRIIHDTANVIPCVDIY